METDPRDRIDVVFRTGPRESCFITLAVVQAFAVADEHSGGQFHRDLQAGWDHVRDGRERERHFRTNVAYVLWQATDVVSNA